MSADLEPLWTDVVVAWASVATAIILVIAGFIAWWQASEARRLRRAQSRPFVVIDLDPRVIHQFAELRIANVGTTMAREVTFDFTPALQSTLDSRADRPSIGELEILKNGIRNLPPGKEIRFVFDFMIDRKKAQLPDTYSVTLRYEGEEVRRLFRRTRREGFTDETTLDLGIYWNLTHVTRYGVHEIHERLKEIKADIRDWSVTGGGLLVLSPEDYKRRMEEWTSPTESEQAPVEPEGEKGDG